MLNRQTYRQTQSRHCINAFTLAEVLITLGIIGVVAAMTIPTLMNKTNDAELRAAWKKDFSVVSQATLMIMNDNGGSLTSVFTSHDQMKDVFKQYLQHSRDCNAADNCAYTFKYMDGHTETTPNQTALFLNDGSLLEFWLNDANCTTVEGSSGMPSCGDITVDVNGPKKPNVVGKDIFNIFIQKDRLLPAGSQGFTGAYAGCDTASFGWGCSSIYLYK